MTIRAFIFDIGGVLINYDLDVLANMVARGSPAIVARANALRTDPSLVEVETGRMSGREYFEKMIRPLAPSWTYRDLVRAWVEVFTANPGGSRLFRELRSRGYPTYLMSNLADFNAEAIAEKFPRFFEETSGSFLSFEMGVVKPEPGIYLAACRRIGAAPGECFFIDDTPVCVDGARRAGMRAELFSAGRIAEIRERIFSAVQAGGEADAPRKAV